MPLNLVFCGTPAFAVPTLEKLVGAGHHVHLVVTQPDRPRGRGMELAFSPVKQRALDFGLPVTQPRAIKENPEFRAQLAELQPDAIIVVGYGRIIPPWMLDLPRLGNINLHASLLPKYRGAAPIQWAIARGETVTGVSTMRLDVGLDTGDILQQKEVPVLPDDTSETLGHRLAHIGADLMLKTLSGLEDGAIVPHAQDNSAASLAPILKKEDGRIDFSRTAHETVNRLRGFQPWPGAFTTFRGKNLQVWAATPVSRKIAQGTVLAERDRAFVGCGNATALELLEVQLEGKKRIAARDFIHGHRIQNGEKLGEAVAQQPLKH